MRVKSMWGIALVLTCSGVLSADRPMTGYQIEVIARGLDRPTGIVAEGNDTLYVTLVPAPGVPGANSVIKLELEDDDNTTVREMTTIHAGEPEPTNLALDREGNLYWTCKSAGVILRHLEDDDTTSPLLQNLQKPVGIAVDGRGDVYFTQVPQPGVAGGSNTVSAFNGRRIRLVHSGDPEPTDVAVEKSGRHVYWTCQSAGVILVNVAGETSLLLGGLDHPVGLALDERRNRLIYTEVPTPGVPGGAGGRNRVSELDLASGAVRVIHQGDPEPTDVTVTPNGTIYWTCSSAGVIVEAKPVRRRH